MGILDSIKSLFSKSGKAKPRPRKAGPKKATQKKKIGKSAKNTDLKLKGKTKGRKKSKQIKADPIDEAALGFSISLNGKDAHSKKRSALRITVKGLTVYIPRLKKPFDVSDISATGLGFLFEKPRIKGGAKIKMDLVLNGEKMAEGLRCKVIRHERGQVGCIFIDLDRAQDDAVHKIVLLGQKEQAERRKAKKNAS